MQESLFQEHWRRFILLPQQVVHKSDAVFADALFQNDQLLWSLGVIPWRAWRFPFQKVMLCYLHEYCPKAETHLYDMISTALASTHGNYLAPPSESDRKNLCETLCSFITDTFTLTRLTDHLYKTITKTCSAESNNLTNLKTYANSLSVFLHFRIANDFLKKYIELFPQDSEKTKLLLHFFLLTHWQMLLLKHQIFLLKNTP